MVAAVLGRLGRGACGSALASAAWEVAPPPVVAAHAKHLRAAADFFFWLLLNWPGALSAEHSEHRLADGFDEATTVQHGWRCQSPA